MPPPGRSIVSHDWAFGDGDTDSGVTVSHVYDVPGIYSVTLTVTDDRGVDSSTTAGVTVVTSEPTASFVFSPTAPTTTTSVQFNAGASTASSGRAITDYAWNFGDGSTATGVTTNHTFSTAGDYNVALTVTDTSGEVGTTTSLVTVTADTGGGGGGGGGPTASFVLSPSNPTATVTDVSFDASASTDPSGTITDYSWNFGDGFTGSGVTELHRFQAAGIFNVSLTVTSSTNATSTITLAVTVTGLGAGAPTADFVFSPNAPTTTTVVQFNGGTSTASTGTTITGYAWNFGDGTIGTGVTTTNTFTAAGTYNVVLTVTDSSGSTDAKSSTVTVTAVGAGSPTAIFVSSPTAPTTAAPVEFDATASTSPAGTALTYAWNFGDGTTGTGVTPSHTFTTANTYTVVLTVTDTAGATGTTSNTVTVIKGPTAIFTASPSPTPLGALTVVDAAASTPSDGATIASYMWNFGDTTATGTCSVPAAGGDDPACPPATPWLLSHTYLVDASYTITLTVTDSLGQTDVTTQSITVSP